MALKFLNKKGWHTGSLRNIEIVWKAEQKHEAEKRKLEELKKQIHDEREAQEFRALQEQAGLIPKQERLEFLYDSGLAVGRNSTEEYLLGKPVEEKKGEDDVTKVAAAPGSLFVEEKPHSANDAWRKLHTDPLLLIRQQEQAALARIRNNPVKMGLIKKSVEENIAKKDKRKKRDGKERKHKEKKRKTQHTDDSGSSNPRSSPVDKKVTKAEDHVESGNYLDRGRRPEREEGRSGRRSSLEGNHNNSIKRRESSSRSYRSPERRRYDSPERNGYDSPLRKRYGSRERRVDSPARRQESVGRNGTFKNRHDSPDSSIAERDTELKMKGSPMNERDNNKQTNGTEGSKQNMKQHRRKLTDEERAARLKEMQEDAEVHEEQRWHRLKKASDADQLEEARRHSNGRNFVNQTARSIYGADRGGSISVEESVRRRTHFIERSIGDGSSNTFQRM